MNKDQLSAKLAALMGLPSRAAAERIIDALFDPADGIIPDALAAGDVVGVQGFGILEARPVAARTARNPRTGEPVAVPAHRRPVFRAASALRDRVAV